MLDASSGSSPQRFSISLDQPSPSISSSYTSGTPSPSVSSNTPRVNWKVPLCPEFELFAHIVYSVAELNSDGVPVIIPVSLVERPGIVPLNSKPSGNAG